MASAPCIDAPFSGSYDPADVTFLLRPVALVPTDRVIKERLIQSGARHYSEMIADEAPPGRVYLDLYDAALARNGGRLAGDIATLAAALDDRAPAGREIILVSLARAGTPVGALLLRAVCRRGRRATHYSISIIRDRGIDRVALAHITARHAAADIVFVDGWTGKGAIAGELHRSLSDRPFGIAPFLAVVADPAGRADVAATGEDYLIASGLLNGIVSGLVSRSILNAVLVGDGQFHACVHYCDYAAHDRSRAFIDRIDGLVATAEARAALADAASRARRAAACDATIAMLARRYAIDDRNRIKPGIAEATRAVLRRLPERILVRDPADPDVAHLVHLAAEQAIPVDPLDAGPFRAVTLIGRVGTAP